MKSRFSRRKFLAGTGVAIGLPYLESLDPRAQAAVSCNARQRFIACFVPCGINMPEFTPATTGKNWTAPYILSPLEPVRSKIAVLTGIDYEMTAHPAAPPGGHGAGTGSFLTMMPVHNNATNPLRTSLDQRIATDTAACGRPLPSLQLGVTVPANGCDGAPSCSFLECISWSKNNPLPNIVDPGAAFDRIFAGYKPMTAGTTPAAAAAEADRRKLVRTSILDRVIAETTSLQTDLGSADRAKMDELLTSIRSLETRIQTLDSSGGGGGTCTVPAKTTVTNTAPYQTRVPIMLELAALALQCDQTRVITFMFGRGTSNQDFSFLLGSTVQHHPTSHHGGNAENLRKLKEIGHWEMDQWATFLKRLDGMTEAGGKTVLDNSLAYFNSEIGDGNAHTHYDFPIVLAGSAGGKLKVDGSHYMYTKMSFPRPIVGPMGGPHGIKVFVSILNAFGIPDQTFGDGSATGPLPELMV
jgi:hypothetical protein